MKIKVKYHSPNLTKLEKITVGDWIDLRSAEDINVKKGSFLTVSLGVSMELPEGYEAIIAPRSSSFKKYGFIQVNSIGVVDNSYSGDNDTWMLPIYAVRDVEIHFNDRICQFRIQKKMEDVEFEEVDHLDNKDRGGFGSTGTN